MNDAVSRWSYLAAAWAVAGIGACAATWPPASTDPLRVEVPDRTGPLLLLAVGLLGATMTALGAALLGALRTRDVPQA